MILLDLRCRKAKHVNRRRADRKNAAIQAVIDDMNQRTRDMLRLHYDKLPEDQRLAIIQKLISPPLLVLE